jgi:hypothetical protein
MCQLQSDEKPALRTRRLAMFFDENLSQFAQALAGVRCHDKLIRIRPPFVRNRNCLPTPNEFCSALPESPPTANCMFTGLSVRSAIPTFHRLNGDPIADADSIAHKGPQQW